MHDLLMVIVTHKGQQFATLMKTKVNMVQKLRLKILQLNQKLLMNHVTIRRWQKGREER